MMLGLLFLGRRMTHLLASPLILRAQFLYTAYFAAPSLSGEYYINSFFNPTRSTFRWLNSYANSKDFAYKSIV